MDKETGQWYTNKELFEQILSVKNDMKELSGEMKATRETIKKYNGLREKIEEIELESRQKIDELENELIAMKAKTTGKSAILKSIREWGGWVVAIIALVVNFYK